MKTRLLIIIGMIISIVIGSVAYTTDFKNADVDDINKGVGKTDVLEPEPTDGENKPNDRTGDANLYEEYRVLEKPQFAVSSLSNQELRDELQKLEQSRLPISTRLIDYDLKRIVLYSPDLTIENKIAEILGDTPFVLLWEEAPPRWETGDPKPEK